MTSALKPSAFGLRFRRLLRLHKLNQKSAAKLFRISQGAVSQLVNGGTVDASRATIARIHQVTGCDLQWLVTGKAAAIPDSIRKLSQIMRKRREA